MPTPNPSTPTLPELVERTRREQGLPPTVEDPEALEQIATALANRAGR